MSATKRDETTSQKWTPAEALILLRSTIGEVLKAGIVVGARNGKDGLILTIKGASVEYNKDGAANFVPQSVVRDESVVHGESEGK